MFFCLICFNLVQAQQLTVVMTAYSSSVDQTDSTPFITSTNQKVRPGIVAASRDLLASGLPYGTKLRVVEVKDTSRCGGWNPDMTLEVQDTMHQRKRNQLDIWMTSTSLARKWGRCEVTVEVLGSGEEFVQTPSTSEEPQSLEERTIQVADISQEKRVLFIEAASKISVDSFAFYEVASESSVTTLATTTTIDSAPVTPVSVNTTVENSTSSSLTTSSQQPLVELASQTFLVSLLYYSFSAPTLIE